jgi:hypothetical protein
MKFKHTIALLLGLCAVLASLSPALIAQSDPQPVPVVSQSPEQLQQLIAPIALYPDELVAQVLAAATYPSQVVEADRWLQAQQNLNGEELAQAVDQQSWDPSVKALTQFPSVLANMDKNLSWTSSLGDAYVNQSEQVMDAVQEMRRRAQQAGYLESSPQQTVKTEDQTIAIEPAEPQVVYVPQYDPWLVYGAAVPVWPGWYPYPGLFLAGPGFGFGAGFNIGFFGGFGWGWHHWGSDWGHRRVVYNRNTYISHSNTFIHRNRSVNSTFNDRNTLTNHNTFNDRNSFNNRNAVTHSGGSSAFGGFNHGGTTMNHSVRGQSSSGTGSHQGGFGGGGFHGGGGRR